MNNERTIARVVIQGDYAVSHNSKCMMTSVLGSCVAVCLFDPKLRIGGMNHFLLPGAGYSSSENKSCGLNMMELLINGLLRYGARRKNFQAKLFGGANVLGGISEIGAENAEFARAFLTYEGIPILSESLGGTQARRLRFWPTTGNARQKFVVIAKPELTKTFAPSQQIKPMQSFDVELF